MSFNFLPLPILIMLIVGASIAIFLMIFKNSWFRNEKLIITGYFFMSAGAIGSVIIRANNELHLFSNTTWLGLLVLFCTSSGIVVFLIGRYQKIKDNLIEKKIFLRIVFGWLGFMILMSIFLGFIYLKMKQLI